MTSPAPGTDRGFFQIAELEVVGSPVTYHSVAALTSLEVDGSPIAGFDQATLDYGTTAGPDIPQISAVPAANGSVIVIPPTAVPGSASIIVTSEDGSATRTYTVQFSSPGQPSATTLP